jgi:hypothetical protein
MGLLNFLKSLISGSKLQCPGCGTMGAQQGPEGKIHCKNPSCSYFDPGSGKTGRQTRGGTSLPTEGSFRPTEPVTIRYRNFAGQDRVFEAERKSMVRKGNHLVGKVAPRGGEDRFVARSHPKSRGTGSTTPAKSCSGSVLAEPARTAGPRLSQKNMVRVRRCMKRFVRSIRIGNLAWRRTTPEWAPMT